jgi:cytochrome c
MTVLRAKRSGIKQIILHRYKPALSSKPKISARMKKTIFISLLGICLFTLKVSAQDSTTETVSSAPAFSIADSSTFTGKYKYEGLPFEYMEISVKDGKLYYSGGEYNGPLDAISDKKDAFDASGAATFTFLRDGDNKVTTLQIDYQGQIYTGNKE